MGHEVLSVVILVAVTAAALSIVFFTLRCGISPMPSSTRARDAMVRIVAAERPRGVVYELGAGWGTVAVPLSASLPDCRVVAYELSPFPWALLKLRALVGGRSNLEVRRRDFLRDSYSDAAAIVCYLYPRAMERLRSILECEPPAEGTMLVSNTFAVPGWEPENVVELNDLYATRIYTYRTGATARVAR